ncbi:hypothetical protein CCACVL1_07861 [Corchorus capsularis]|uniref:Uncharacterized protein n=1 Tax=Corchorus capsularis TaxID=210143 RepID=A0A1R3J3J5_COCAP|nr:hypothetical protein CCACVL1_07861 [Corchorus capsularis]
MVPIVRHRPVCHRIAASVVARSRWGASEAKAAEKTTFDINLEKFDTTVKLKMIKEVRVYMDLGLIFTF